MSDNRIDAYDPTRLYENRPECRHIDSPAVKKAAPPPPPPKLPEDLPEASFGPLPRPTRADVSSVRTVAPDAPPTRSAIQARLDAFRESATPVFTAEGRSVPVRIPFRMPVPDEAMDDPRNAIWVTQEKTVQANRAAVNAAGKVAGLSDDDISRLHDGRATPGQVRAVTQALIDAGRLKESSPDAPDLPMRIRQMMVQHGIGLDCAAYTQQAYLASRGLTRRATGLAANIEMENLSNLSSKGFARVALSDARPGDILILRPPKGERVGHTLIVYDHREATPDEAAALRSERLEGRIEAFVVDSSFGSNAEFDQGGVMRQIWWRDEKGTWARKMETLLPDGRKEEEHYEVSRRDSQTHAEQLYGPDYHSIEGMYRARGAGR